MYGTLQSKNVCHVCLVHASLSFCVDPMQSQPAPIIHRDLKSANVLVILSCCALKSAGVKLFGHRRMCLGTA
jgi:serine/threonine protein kinase